jgi:hypothetical protein
VCWVTSAVPVSLVRFLCIYNGRHHTTVLYAIGKIERLRKTDESIDALIEVLTAGLSPKMECRFTERFEPEWSTGFIEAVAARVLNRITGGREEGTPASLFMNTATQIKDGARMTASALRSILVPNIREGQIRAFDRDPRTRVCAPSSGCRYRL